MTPPKGTCELCGSEIASYQYAAYPVTGWEVQRLQGGANQIVGKQRLPNRIAHARCVEARLRRGDQEQMEMSI